MAAAGVEVRSRAAAVAATCFAMLACDARCEPDLPQRSRDAAARVRASASIEAGNLPARFARADEALVLIDALIAEAAAHDPGLLAQLSGDRVQALAIRHRWSDVLAQVEGMRAGAMPIRPYVREAEADALLALRRPAEARAIYAELAADPGNRAARLGRFFAEVECEDFDAAFRTADALDDAVIAALARHYAGLDADAWPRMVRVAAERPHAAYVHAAMASIAAARGWPRRSHEHALEAARLAADDFGIRVGLAESYLRRRDLETARAIAAPLLEWQGEVAAALRLAREIGDYTSASWRIDARGRRESGGAAQAPGPGMELAARVDSRAWRDAYRVFAAASRASARPAEGYVVRERAGGGLQWQGPDNTIDAAAWSNWGSVARAGASVAGTWSPDDFWRFSGDYERYAWETPLRAILHGITADGGGVAANASWSESRTAYAGVRAHRFTDGNRREQARLAWAERIHATPRWTFTLRPELYASRNSRADAPYFNPSRDASASIALDAQGLIARTYEASWRQRVTVRTGVYRQRGFDDGWVGAFAYEQAWRPGTRSEWRWGVEAGRARYDGANENFAILFVSAAGIF